MDPKRIILAGGSGFLGHALATALVARNYEVIVLTRSPRDRNDGVMEVEWSGAHIGEWIQFMEGAEAVVNLTGRNVNCPHTPENLREILESRLNSVRAISVAFAHATRPPRVWVQAGATGFYGDTGNRLCDEQSAAGSNALARICVQWESVFNKADTPKVRRVLLRIGFVLGREGGALPVLARLTRLYLGGSVGSGKQFISWIHLADLTRMFVEAIERADASGTFNAVAPDPVTNAEFMGELRRALRRPWSPPAPEFAVRLGARLMGSEPSLALTSQRCAPQRFAAAGFQYQFPELAPALNDLCRKI
ncbi:MAG TPA: TIGR01777 family oxidoreductase [Verrucomicrobiae bacterium]|nr:TIGR01777 family oxidoreductase [Verrucomicrobiae bacterium]